MKKALLYLSFLLLPSVSVAQFQIMNSGSNKALEDVFFIDKNIGVAVGDSGTIVRSTDGGLNWTTVMSVDTVSFKKVGFFDSQHGVAVGNDIYSTNNSGLTWTLRYEGSGNFNHTGDLEILNDSICLASNNQVALIRSTDKGHTWDTLFTNNTGYTFQSMSFINDTVGFASSAIGPPHISILKTTNGGISWDTLMSSSPWNNTVLEDMVFINDQVGFQTGWYNGHFIKTSDGGGSWNGPAVDSNISIQLIDMDIHADRPNSYYACGWYGEILKSNDGGNNWQRIDHKITTNTLRGIYFINDTLGWVVGTNGLILRTINGGGALSVKDYRKLEFVVYPNPTKDKLHISLPIDPQQKSTIELIDMTGKLISQTSFNGKIVELNVSTLSPAIYFIKISRGEQVGIQRVLIE